MKKILLAAAIVALPSAALAQYGQPFRSQETQLLVNNLGLDSNRAFTVKTEGYSLLTLYQQYTHATNGTLTLTCTGKSAAAADNSQQPKVDSTPTTCTTASGTCTLNFAGVFVSPTLSADKDYTIVIGVAGEVSVTCTMAHGGAATAGDLLTITGRLSTN